MFFKSIVSVIAIIILSLVWLSTAEADITINPVGFGIAMEENERGNGPNRDDFGDQVGGYDVDGDRWYGLAWDGELIWGIHYNDGRLQSRNEDGEIVQTINNNVQQPLCLCWDGEAFWTTSYPNSQIHRLDLEGNIITTLNVGGQAAGVTWDGENLWWTPIGGPFIRQITVEGEVLRTLDLRNMQNSRLSVAWVPEHDDPMWAFHTDGSLYQLNIENDVVEVLQETDYNLRNQWGLTHDGEHLWYTAPNRWNRIDDGIAEFNMLVFDPEEGVIPGNESTEISTLVISEGVEPGVYNVLITIETELESIDISAIVSVDSPVVSVTCGVIDAETEEDIGDVIVDIDRYLVTRFTDENGTCEFENLPAGEYEFTFTATDYLTLTEPYRIDGEGELDFRVELLHSECNLNLEEIATELPEGEQEIIPIEVSNDGNGSLIFSTDRRLIGDANAVPWELRSSLPAGVITEDSRIQGVVFANGLFYMAGANNRDPLMYVVNQDNEVVDQYPQLGEGRYGYKDLAFDGELIWGSGERNIYGFTIEGQEVTSFDSGISPCTNIAWDNDRELLWASGTTSDIVGLDRDGNQVAEISRHDLRTYGLAYWPDDPDGYQLYVFHKINDVGDMMIAKIDIENEQMLDVIILEHEFGGVALGCFITNQYDIYSWVFMGCANSGAEDRIDTWQVDARKDWMEIEPTEGIIEAESQQEFEITLDATGLPAAVFEGEIVFTHDGIGGETHLPISLQVGEGGGGPQEMTLELNNGWNMVSAFIQPDPDDVREITAELVEAGTLIMMKNTVGQFYNPQFNFNNIPGWRVAEGYMVKMDDADELMIEGIPVAPDDPIALRSGWQIVSYFPRQPIDAIVALSGLGENLLMAKDGSGHFYNPAFNFSNMGDMVPGQGYLIKVNDDGELIYNIEDELASYSANYSRQPLILPTHPSTTEYMSLLVFTELRDGEIGVYANGRLVGSGVITDGKCGIAVWGDDPTTSSIDGALNGEKLDFTFVTENGQKEVLAEYIEGSGEYSPDGFQAIRLLESNSLPNEFGLDSIYPNPFNNRCTITYNLEKSSFINLILFDLAGRRIIEFDSGFKTGGSYAITIDGATLASGIYIIQLESETRNSKRKVTLLK